MPFTIYSERLDNETAKQYAYRILRRNILLLDMVPGEPIMEKVIASQLQISRTPVREALLDLCRERLIEIFPQRSTRVSLMDAELVDQGRFLRITIENAIIELACKMLREEHIAKLEKNLAEQQKLADENDIIEFFSKDNEFHRILFEVCNKELAFDAIGLFMPHFLRERMLRLQMFDAKLLLCDHRDILDAIMRKDCVQAKKSLSEHLNHVICDQEVIKKGYPHYFIAP